MKKITEAELNVLVWDDSAPKYIVRAGKVFARVGVAYLPSVPEDEELTEENAVEIVDIQ